MKDNKLTCMNCHYDKIEYQDTREFKEKSIKANIVAVFSGNYKIKIMKALYHCPHCEVVSAYPIKEGKF